jgi:tRNA A-37 threonylcarbamoyl transferase component Bud32
MGDTDPLAAGDRVDRYEIVELLGSGGMGEVYRARDPKLARQVALKILRRRGGGSEGGARVLREARAIATLSHPNVLAIYDADEAKEPESRRGLPYIAMELVVGSSLRAFVGDASVSMERRLAWLRSVAEALAAAHVAGIIHRDVKPENVMIRFDGVAKVLDFGIARQDLPLLAPAQVHALTTLGPGAATDEALFASTATGNVSGTLHYMAPEQLEGDRVDGRADQFSWGVMAWEVLAGALPWSGVRSAPALAAAILTSHARSLAEVVPGIPPAVSDAVARALSKAREARFPTMDALVDALDGRASASSRPAAGAPSATRASAEGGGGARPKDRRAGVRALAAVGVVAALGIAGAGVWRGRASSGANDREAARPAARAGCTSSKACVDEHGGAPWICRAADRTCVALASEDCVVHAAPGDVERDSTVWLGTILPSRRDESGHVVELARMDFADTLGKVNSARRIGVVACDASNPARAAHHLADVVHVPAALLGLTSADTIVDVVSNVFTPAQVVSILPFTTVAYATALPQGPAGRLVWRTTFSSEQLIAPIAAFVESVVEPEARRRAPHRTVRVGYVHPKDVSSRIVSDRLASALRFNGKSAVENGNDFREVSFDDGDAGQASALERLASFLPTAVIVYPMHSQEATRVLVEGLESGWPQSAPPPTYVFLTAIPASLQEFVASSAGRRQRFFGTDLSSNGVANADFSSHYGETFPKDDESDASSVVYDGFYALAYAVHTLGDAAVTGPSIAGAFGRLRGPGKTFRVGPQAIFAAYVELRAGATIDLEGASSHLELDPSTGESTYDIALRCMAPLDRDAGPREVESGVVYGVSDQRLRGTPGCR